MTVDDPRPVDLHALLETVQDESSYVASIEALGRDFALEQAIDEGREPDPCVQGSLGWYNWSLDSVFEAAAACWKARRHLQDEAQDANPWRRCAEILYWGKFYE